MFIALANTGLIASSAQQICKALHDNLAAAESFHSWLAAQADADLTGLNPPFAAGDVNLLRAAFADLHALNLLAYGYPAPASYGITGTYDFSVNVKEIVGPQ